MRLWNRIFRYCATTCAVAMAAHVRGNHMIAAGQSAASGGHPAVGHVEKAVDQHHGVPGVARPLEIVIAEAGGQLDSLTGRACAHGATSR